jgi:hypothetical protein
LAGKTENVIQIGATTKSVHSKHELEHTGGTDDAIDPEYENQVDSFIFGFRVHSDSSFNDPVLLEQVENYVKIRIKTTTSTYSDELEKYVEYESEYLIEKCSDIPEVKAKWSDIEENDPDVIHRA